MRTVVVSSELPADADRVWEAMKDPATFAFVCRGLLGLPGLAGRTDPARAGDEGRTRLLLLHVLPLHVHEIRVVRVDEQRREIETEERGGAVRRWNHVLRVEPLGPGRSRYTDTVRLDAGPLTPVVAATSTGLYRYRHARWQRLARTLAQ